MRRDILGMVLRKEIESLWKQWLEKLPDEVAVPRCITTHQQEITDIELLGFGDLALWSAVL